MLRVDLGRLWREGSVRVEALVPPEHALWQGCGAPWADAVRVELAATVAGTGEVVVRGRIRGTLDQECRRCLRPVATAFDQRVTLVFVAAGAGAESGGEEAFTYDPGKAELDLGEAVREEVMLAMNPYVVCDPECKGLCARCGANLNEGACGCAEEETDPRWEALRQLKEK